ncbi:MAG: UvrD-helicase domain-containing protein [Bacteroidales bacterium]|nr:UvrD-helicase domain-containing protein [Bacteroidales bacterium]
MLVKMMDISRLSSEKIGIFIIRMGPGIIIRYKASAGAGKTYELASVYLRSLFRDPASYRSILAVTFTNKASAEMKERILHNLYLLSRGEKSEYFDLLCAETGMTAGEISRYATEILNRLLHDYSRFSVGTIDSFFQKVLRSFARESGLQAGFNVILDSGMILLQAVDELLRDAETDSKLLDWLIEFAHREILEGKSWNLKKKILDLGEEIFREKYRILRENGLIIENKEILKSAISGLYAFQNRFRASLADMAAKALEILDRNGVTNEMLYYRSRSIRKFLSDALDNIPTANFKNIRLAAEEGKYSSGKRNSPELDKALSQGLDEIIKSLAKEYDKNIRLYNSVRLVLDNLYTLGILNDIASRTRQLLSGQNKFLLSDAGDILRRIIALDQTPFIYEKMGSRYKNFMIDEFQDTSWVQWDNFRPLLNNSLAEGENSLLVGDIKQSIYRWRNSDWEIFDRVGEAFHPGSFKTETLRQNWRSAANIIEFNNAVFSELPGRVEEDMELKDKIISGVYDDVVQDDPGKYSKGYVRMQMYGSEDEGRQKVLDDLPGLIEEIQDHGYMPGDIGILVRTRNEGQEVIDRLSTRAAEHAGASKYSYQVISQDSLMLNSSPPVVFIVSVLKYLMNKEDKVNRAVMLQHYLLSHGRNEIDRPLFLANDDMNILSANNTLDFDSFLDNIRYLSVYEMIDRLIAYTGLNNIHSAQAYLLTLQNYVLEFAGVETNDIPAFLEWWENEGQKKSVSSTGQSDAMQLMTIHKAKGLQFRVVVLPFISWPFRHEVNPVLWIHSDHMLLNKLGAVPVRMKKEFIATYFEDFYYDERGRAAVDKINMLYVAFTRARECLYGNLIADGKGKTSGSYIFDILSDEQDNKQFPFSKYLDREKRIFSFGKIPAGKSKGEMMPDNPLIEYPLVLNDNRLRLKRHGKSYFTGRSQPGGARKYYGLLMHEIIASIKTAGDVEDAVRQCLIKGAIRHEEYIDIKNKILKALDHKDVKEWFTEDVTVINEKDILVPGGKIRRPDRIIFKENRVIVIDFKFGNPEPEHKKQLEEYRLLLKQMGYENLEAYLWYVEHLQVIPLNGK